MAMQTSIHYIARTPNLDREKAFTTDFPVDHVEGAVRQNTKADHRQVLVNAIDQPDRFNLDEHGFCFLRGRQINLDPEKACRDKDSIEQAYWSEIEAILHEQFPQYSRIECFDTTVRKRDPDFPEVVRVYREEHEQPSPVVHCDWSSVGSLDVLRWCFPGNENFWEGKRFDMLKLLVIIRMLMISQPISVWRPLKTPTDDWPLALCDYTTVDTENDVLLEDAIRRDRVEEISSLHYNENHRWYYLKDQGVDDLLVFRNADSHGENASK
ncbi:unnamed protein product [Clonostachys chloroleuca]|uniref:Uncharacterized protein n=1 Tax=Clonostachys chloroleuca TaxID=1926264 RepID=A0AA35LTN9_9HYPO|nr:unnamed protein product [Clonostachys chloroleuca]